MKDPREIQLLEHHVPERELQRYLYIQLALIQAILEEMLAPPDYADNAAALAGGLAVGDWYRNSTTAAIQIVA